MKNIHLLSTQSSSRIHSYGYEGMKLSKTPLFWKTAKHLYITSDENIKEGDWCYDKAINPENVEYSYYYLSKKNSVDMWTSTEKKVILTTDQNLIKEGVQEIDEEFLQWFVDNSSCEEVELNKIYNDYGETDIFDLVCTSHSFKYKLIIPKMEYKRGYTASETKLVGVIFTLNDGSQQLVPFKHTAKVLTTEEVTENRSNAYEFLDFDGETVEEVVAEKFKDLPMNISTSHAKQKAVELLKWQAERMYSEEEVRQILLKSIIHRTLLDDIGIPDWFNENKK